MTAQELRIGNILKIYTGEYAIVDSLISEGVIGYNIKGTEFYVHFDPDFEDKNGLSPVEITHEILEKCGFVHSPSGKSYFKRIPVVKGEIHFDKFRGSLVCVVYCSTGSFFPVDIIYLHQLQNLYFALTGEELTINL